MTIGSPRVICYPVVTAVEAPDEMNKQCWPCTIAGRVREDKAESTCLDNPVYSFEGSSGAYYKNTYEREKSLTYTIIPIITGRKVGSNGAPIITEDRPRNKNHNRDGSNRRLSLP